MSAPPSLIYVGDPMCSWCWGFAPELEQLARDHPIEVVVGGLRPGPAAQLLDDRLARSLRHHWTEIAERTGQPFDVTFLERRDGWIYDTEPAAMAVVTIRAMRPERTLDYFTEVQAAFYVKGRDVTDFSVLADLGSGMGLDDFDLPERIRSDEAKQAAWQDFTRARRWGIGGFPSLIARLDAERLALVARGWADAGTIRSRLEALAADV